MAFVHMAAASSFVGASQRRGLPASALGKSISRTPGSFSVLWPSSRQLSAKLRAFVDSLSARLFAHT